MPAPAPARRPQLAPPPRPREAPAAAAPIPLRPAHHETLTSYVARLAAVHALPYEDLWTCLSAPTGSGSRRLIVPDRLAAATGRPTATLEHALPELRDPPPDWKQWRHYPQRAGPLCSAEHRSGVVRRLFAHHEMLCTRHGYWIGSTEFGIDHHPPAGQCAAARTRRRPATTQPAGHPARLDARSARHRRLSERLRRSALLRPFTATHHPRPTHQDPHPDRRRLQRTALHRRVLPRNRPPR